MADHTNNTIVLCKFARLYRINLGCHEAVRTTTTNATTTTDCALIDTNFCLLRSIQRKIGSDLQQFEAIETLANQLGSSLKLAEVENQPLKATQQTPNFHHQLWRELSCADNLEAPAPRPAQVSKMELYNNEEADEVFRDIDRLAINVAREDQQSFTDLVHHLTRHCLTDIERARAIFRWITVKNLNTMHFDSSVKPDTPLGLLRGIKNGSESYHVLFKRLCR